MNSQFQRRLAIISSQLISKNQSNSISSNSCSSSSNSNNSASSSSSAVNGNNLVFSKNCGGNSLDEKKDCDVVIVEAVRTALGRGRRGTFKDTSPDKLLQPLFEHMKNKFFKKLDDPSKQIGDCVLGMVLPPGGFGATQVRVAQLLAGFPKEIPCSTVNRQCASGLQAIVAAAGNIKAGIYDAAFAGGVESMSLNWGKPIDYEQLNSDAMNHDLAKGCYMSMGMTSEEVAKRYKISRTAQDQAATDSHQKAKIATEKGFFKNEIIPITVTVKDKEGNEVERTLSQDEGIRPNTTVERLAKLKPAFIAEGSTTAGNASQVSDGAALTFICSRAFAKKYNLPILGKFITAAQVGVEPAVMGIGPAVAIPLSVEKAGLTLNDIDLFEINEAFASQFLYSVEHLKIDKSKVNIQGGAMAIGHPLGCTGARMTATVLHALKRTNKKYGVVSMCIGTGMGMSAVFKAE